MFSSVLIANRGEIACRIAATCKRLQIRTIAVYSETDAAAPHVKVADEAICIGPAPALQSYLNQAALIGAIETSGAEAVHPGYGFLSENPTFAAAVTGAGAVFVGPNSNALEQLSDKLGARALASRVGLQPVPGTSTSMSDDIEAVVQVANSVGWPLLVKAAAGGGGIGMQRAANPAELEVAIQSSRALAQRAFGDGRLYLERFVNRPRHVEIQVIRSKDGFQVALGHRECSVQRRYQKLVEECPSPAFVRLDPDRLQALQDAALRLFEVAGYVGVGTVEMLLDRDGSPYFLEVNARLQVEHTVTEMVYGIDLVEQQLRLAAGLDVSQALAHARSRGHAIEARVYAEDPRRGFMPQPGMVEALVLPEGEGIRVDCGIECSCDVSPHYDPLLAKIVAWGQTRLEATARLSKALSATKIEIHSKHGLRVNNLSLLQRILTSGEWGSADYDTGLVERLGTES